MTWERQYAKIRIIDPIRSDFTACPCKIELRLLIGLAPRSNIPQTAQMLPFRFTPNSSSSCELRMMSRAAGRSPVSKSAKQTKILVCRLSGFFMKVVIH
jgi:hypothetical protein